MIACTVRLAEHLDAEAALALARDFATSFVVDSTAFSESFSTLSPTHTPACWSPSKLGRLSATCLASST